MLTRKRDFTVAEKGHPILPFYSNFHPYFLPFFYPSVLPNFHPSFSAILLVCACVASWHVPCTERDECCPPIEEGGFNPPLLSQWIRVPPYSMLSSFFRRYNTVTATAKKNLEKNELTETSTVRHRHCYTYYSGQLYLCYQETV